MTTDRTAAADPRDGVVVGDPAPEFELSDQFNQPVRLSDFRERRNVVVVFYPMSFSQTCQAELCGFRDDLAAYHNDDAALLAISVDSPVVHRRFAEDQGYDFPLLADFWPHGEVARRYGVFDATFGVALRGTFVVDREGYVRHVTVNPVATGRDHTAVRHLVAELS